MKKMTPDAMRKNNGGRYMCLKCFGVVDSKRDMEYHYKFWHKKDKIQWSVYIP